MVHSHILVICNPTLTNQNTLFCRVSGAPRPWLVRATVNIEDSRAVLKINMRFYVGAIFVLQNIHVKDPCPYGLPAICPHQLIDQPGCTGAPSQGS